MPSVMVTDRRHITPSSPMDLKWVRPVPVDEQVAEIISAAATRTVLTFAGDSATTVLAALGLNGKELA